MFILFICLCSVIKQFWFIFLYTSLFAHLLIFHIYLSFILFLHIQKGCNVVFTFLIVLFMCLCSIIMQCWFIFLYTSSTAYFYSFFTLIFHLFYFSMFIKVGIEILLFGCGLVTL